jgi:hypothetical protein
MQFIGAVFGAGFLCSDLTHFLKMPMRVLGPIVQLRLFCPVYEGTPSRPRSWGAVKGCSLHGTCEISWDSIRLSVFINPSRQFYIIINREFKFILVCQMPLLLHE